FLSLAAMHEGGIVSIGSHSDRRRFIPREVVNDKENIARSCYGPAITTGTIQVVRDVKKVLNTASCIDVDIQARDVGGAIIAPLTYMEQPLGFLELWSREPLELS